MIENVIKEINYLVKVYGKNGFLGDGNKKDRTAISFSKPGG
ncbi:hypothetical protein C8J23_1792 [Shewanella chilikensis]|uniref:Uncharacterized protein n=1 Tax=Shewanella chilikensis TaxID=558541 RepID=A0ABX5PHA4_9GAMM|nr:hypothetical protein C8J23_1792 [Shewanella chilikensis]GGZ49644.1 hypothetical protein GCM10007105_38670 [Shewanella chilikensis]